MNNGVLMIGMTICNRPLFHWFRKEVVRDNLSLNNTAGDDSEHGEYVDDDGDVDSYVDDDDDDDDDDDSKQMSIIITVVKPTYNILTLIMVIII